MTAADWATIIGAIGGAIVLIIGALMPLYVRQGGLHRQGEQIHELVNQARSDLVTYVGQLVAALEAAGLPVPTPIGGAVTGQAQTPPPRLAG